MFLRPITDFSTAVWVNALRNNFVISSMFCKRITRFVIPTKEGSAIAGWAISK